MSLNQIIYPVNPLNAIFASVKDVRDVVLVNADVVDAGITAFSNFNPGFEVNSLTKYTNVGNSVIREVYLTFDATLASAQVFSFDFQQLTGESNIFTSATLSKGVLIYPVKATTGEGSNPNTLRVSFDYLSGQPATTGPARMNAHMIFVKNA